MVPRRPFCSSRAESSPRRHLQKNLCDVSRQKGRLRAHEVIWKLRLQKGESLRKSRNLSLGRSSSRYFLLPEEPMKICQILDHFLLFGALTLSPVDLSAQRCRVEHE